MTWAKFDDRYDDTKKIKRAWRRNRAAVGLHAMAVTYCSRHETDGHVDEDWLEDKLPVKRERDKVVQVLVETGLFERSEDGFMVHDYLEYNPSRADLQDRRRRDAERKAAGRSRQGDSARTTTPVQPESARTEPGLRSESAGSPMVPSRPVPSLTPPVPPKGGRQRDRQAFEEQVRAFAAELLPDAPEEARVSAVRQACNAGRESTEAVVDHIDQWFPDLGDGLAARLDAARDRLQAEAAA